METTRPVYNNHIGKLENIGFMDWSMLVFGGFWRVLRETVEPPIVDFFKQGHSCNKPLYRKVIPPSSSSANFTSFREQPRYEEQSGPNVSLNLEVLLLAYSNKITW
jgi:hypothetical protein